VREGSQVNRMGEGHESDVIKQVVRIELRVNGNIGNFYFDILVRLRIVFGVPFAQADFQEGTSSVQIKIMTLA